MKKIKKIMLIILGLLITVNVKAVCQDNKINDWAESLEIKFQEVKNEEYPYSYLLMLNNPREDLKVIAKDTYSNGEYNVEYDTDFKNYVIGSEIHFIKKEYELNIYMSDNASTCAKELVKTIKYAVPKYNEYNDTLYCEANPDDKECGAYTDTTKNDKMDDKVKDYYDKQIEKEEIRNLPTGQKILRYILEYAPYVLVPLVILVTVYLIVIKIIKKRSDEE